MWRLPEADLRPSWQRAAGGGVVSVVVAAVVPVLAIAFGSVVSRTDSRETVENAASLENSYQDVAPKQPSTSPVQKDSSSTFFRPTCASIR